MAVVWVEKIQKNPGLAVLLVDGFHDLMILHNLHCLPANVYRAAPKLIALNGADNIADCYRIDPSTGFSDLDFTTPVWRDLKNVTSEDTLKNLLPTESSTTSFKGKRVMLVSSASNDYGFRNQDPVTGSIDTCFVPKIPRIRPD